MDSYVMCQQLKRDVRFSEIPIIFISALDETLDKVKAFEVDGVDYVTKLFQIDEVLARVKTHRALKEAKANIHILNQHLEQLVVEPVVECVTKLLENLVQRNILSLQTESWEIVPVAALSDYEALGILICQADFDSTIPAMQMPEMDGLRATDQICTRFLPIQRPQVVALTTNAGRSRTISISRNGWVY